MGHRHRRGDDAKRPRRRPVAADVAHRLRRQRPARGAAADRKRRADVGDLGLGLLRQPALRHLQLAVAGPYRPPAAPPPARPRLPARRPQPGGVPEGLAGRRPRDRPGALRRRRRGRGLADLADDVVRRHLPVVAGAARVGPGLRRHAVDARHRLLAAQRPHRLGRGDGLRGGGGRRLLAAAEAEHPGRDRRGGQRRRW